MNNAPIIDSVETYFERKGEHILYRPRIYSEYYDRMVPIQGDRALQKTPQKAWAYARRWLGLT